MQELQVKITQAQVEIIDREKFEQNINEVVTKYQNYTVTASTIKSLMSVSVTRKYCQSLLMSLISTSSKPFSHSKTSSIRLMWMSKSLRLIKRWSD